MSCRFSAGILSEENGDKSKIVVPSKMNVVPLIYSSQFVLMNILLFIYRLWAGFMRYFNFAIIVPRSTFDSIRPRKAAPIFR